MIVIDELRVKKVSNQFHSAVYEIATKTDVKLAYVASEVNSQRIHDEIHPHCNIEISYFDPHTGIPEAFEYRYYAPAKK